jgi:hypothetical protein
LACSAPRTRLELRDVDEQRLHRALADDDGLLRLAEGPARLDVARRDDLDHRGPHDELLPRRERHLDVARERLAAVDPRAVRRAEVGDEQTVAVGPQARVPRRHLAVRDDDVRRRLAPHDQLAVRVELALDLPVDAHPHPDHRCSVSSGPERARRDSCRCAPGP